MEHLSDELLIESFYKANELKLSPDFVALIKEEISRRNLAHRIKYTS
ncbi:sporulation histidine kinase inhibitor Sda [Ornithinibacillus gellani]|nr:sporulation histidine kinase inhibitor Sda [Ornithinibacillus gellani]TQS74611.1 sporulation histidine kinase inhibitor Sda [Ornithinibacillus gellani]